MPNNYFRFRQFTVNQEKCAMKVCTDACLFGAWAATKADSGNDQMILDIGSGTGLLSLMVAQKTGGAVHSVEIEQNAFEQSSENFRQSPWSDRLTAFHSSIQDFSPGSEYDFIISNPPFFENDLKSDDKKRNLALHSAALNIEDLVKYGKRLLKPAGEFAILLPYYRSQDLEKIADDNDLFIKEKISVRQSPKYNAFRSMYLLTGIPDNLIPDKSGIIIKDEDNNYTPPFYDLLKDYYLFEKTTEK